MFVSNELWVLSGMRMLGELFILIGVVVFLVIMIETQSKQITNLPMVSLGVSLFVGISFSYRFNLKTMAIMDTQTMFITSCLNFYNRISKDGQEQSDREVGEVGEVREVEEVEEIEWRDV